MEIMTSFQFTQPSHAPSWITSLLSVNTVVLIAMNSFAFVIGTCLLPHLKAVNEEYVAPQEGQTKMNAVPSFSPHEQLSGFIRTSQRISHVFGLFVFLLEVPLVIWVKLWDLSQNACIASTAVMVPFMVIFATFVWFFNFGYKTQMYKNRQTVIDEVENQYKSRSRESLEMTDIFCEEHHFPEINVSQRHSLDANFRPGSNPHHLREHSFHRHSMSHLCETAEVIE
ncbi:calcium release-activated calcium channel protein 1-like [Neocloeon triangulifer]|uniref:calcium release-activated calcium channel protein 1-like n=1 Tax=Neocloeon triangulifer TaxID=2078957 RepID=UPI00286F756A|nr:calcium release-activated calcium channel protein 1-like [Neocloeon triangulifer]